MVPKPTGDPIDEIKDGWKTELPDLDTSAMATVARLNRLGAHIRRRVEAEIDQRGSALGEFDVLAALRRRGKPYELLPSALARTVLLSPSGMTHRIDQLEAAGLVERVVNPSSRRTAPVTLTPDGIAASERLARAVVEVEEEALSSLSNAERAQLDKLLSKLLGGLEAGADDPK